MMKIESKEDFEIMMLKNDVKIGGNIYEERYSFWARLIPDEVEGEYSKLVGKKLSDLTGEELESLNKIAGIMRFAFLQGKVDDSSISKREYIEYLNLRKTRPLDHLRISKMSEDELIEADDLIINGNLSSLSQKSCLTVPERYAREVLEHRNFMRCVNDINEKLSYSAGFDRAMHAESVQLAKKGIFR